MATPRQLGFSTPQRAATSDADVSHDKKTDVAFVLRTEAPAAGTADRSVSPTPDALLPPMTSMPSRISTALLSTPVKLPHTQSCGTGEEGGGFSTPDAPTAGARHSTGSSLLLHHHRRRNLTPQDGTDHDDSLESHAQHQTEGHDPDLDCPICMSPLALRSVYKTRCSHHFHKSCLVESRAAHNIGCPYCRGHITPGLTPFDACAGRVGNDRDQIVNRARAARQAVLARIQQRQGERRGTGGVSDRRWTLSVLREGDGSDVGALGGLNEAFERVAAISGEREPRRVVMAGSTEDLGHRIDHDDDLP